MSEVIDKPSGATNSGSQPGGDSGATAQSNTESAGEGGGVTSITSKWSLVIA